MRPKQRPVPDSDNPNPWLAFDEREEYEDCISGNRKGLEALREAIDKALIDKQARIDIHFSHIQGIVLIEGDQRETARTKNTWRDWIAAAFSLILIVVVLMAGFVAVGVAIKYIKKAIAAL